MADVDGGDPGGAALQQAVGKATGRCPHVEAVTPAGVDPEPIERVLELRPAAGDVAAAGADDQVRLRFDELGGLDREGAVPPHPHLSCAHCCRGSAAGGKVPALGEQGVEALAAHRANRSAAQAAGRQQRFLTSFISCALWAPTVPISVRGVTHKAHIRS